MTEYEITTHPDGKQFIRIEDKWMPLQEVVAHYQIPRKVHYSGYEDWWMTRAEVLALGR